MSWQVSAVANLVIMVAYLGIMVAIARPLIATRQVRSNMLGSTTALIFLTCAVHHGSHGLHMLAPSIGIGDATGLVMREAFTWSIAIWDVFGALVGAAYWTQRRGYKTLIEGAKLFEDLEERARRASEHAALMRVATVIARELPTAAVMALVAEEAARLLGGSMARVVRFEGDHGVCVGAHPDPLEDAGAVPLDSLGAIAAVARTGRPARATYGSLPKHDTARAITDGDGLRSGVASPITVDGTLWGAIAVASTQRESMSQLDEERLTAFADLVSVAVANSEARSWLVAQAATDPLTGLVNHRAFHERLGEEVARSTRSGAPLSLALLDLDFFKLVNDVHGHQAGDRVLREVARRLRGAARLGDVVARIGGEEFAWLMPDTDAGSAQGAAERLRRTVMARPFEPAGTLTVSAGVCDLTDAGGADELLHLADTALYWAKDRGRNRTCVYAADKVGELSARERAVRLERDAALRSLHALARAVDARDPALARHSERVGELAFELALTRGWSRDDAERLRSAGFVHDVGKIGVPDAILLKPARLDEDERAIVETHAALGAEIVADALEPRQVAWIRHHHERWDGHGYPDRIGGEAISEGARLLAVADAWDVMTSDCCYGGAISAEGALREVRACAGAQFWPDAVTALIDVMNARVERDLLSPRPVPAGA